MSITAGWANSQLYSFWLDRKSGRPLGLLTAPVFDGYYFRTPVLATRGAASAQQHARSIRDAVQRVETHFPTVVAKAVRNTVPPEHQQRPNTVYSEFTTRVFDSQTDGRLAILQWFPAAQTLSWKVDGKPTSFIDPERLSQARINGWPFEPDPVWSTLQLYSFFREKDRESFGVTATSALMTPHTTASTEEFSVFLDFPDGGRSDEVSLVVAPLCTQEPDGGTGLHWLDGTIYRECCDEHDRCYYKDRGECCTFWSWFFPWQQGWSCAECNIDVVWCFITGGGGGSGGGGSGGTNEDNECYLGINEYHCSAECARCTSWHL